MALTRRASTILACVALLVGVSIAGGGLWLAARQQTQVTSLIGGPFALVDQNGNPITDAAFKGEPFLVFFGYTHCPDVCPTVLSDMTQMLDSLGKGAALRAAFITVDPDRDTPAVLKDYMSNFDPRIVGLTGSPAAIAAAEQAYRVYARKAPTTSGDYSMDHTSVVYLMNKDGQFVQALNLDQAPDKAAATVRAAVM